MIVRDATCSKGILMAMTKCSECGAQISTKATACPSCGAKIKRTSKLTWIVTGFLALVVVSVAPAIMDGQKAGTKRAEEQAATEAAKTPEQRAAEAEAKAKSEAEFQRVVTVARALKASAKNPASFELVDALYMPSGAVCITYRATNSFNAIVTDNAAIGKDGKSGDWNKLCGGKTGNSYRGAKLAI